MAEKTGGHEFNPKVMEMVEREKKENPNIAISDLMERAQEIDSSIQGMNWRRFHGLYTLRLRDKGKGRGRRKATAKAGETTAAQGPKRGRSRKDKEQSKPTREVTASGAVHLDREGLRSIFLRFARDVTAAEGKAEMLDLVTQMDTYINEASQLVGAGQGNNT